MLIDRISLHKTIESIVHQSGTDYIDAILHFCHEYDLEVETIGAIISKDLNLVSKIKVEAERLHYIKRESQLPI